MLEMRVNLYQEFCKLSRGNDYGWTFMVMAKIEGVIR
jgi:hypothetical protein